MKHRMLGIFLLCFAAWTAPAAADTRFIVRNPSGLTSLQQLCFMMGCSVSGGLDGGLGKIFLVTTPALVDPNTFLQTLRAQPGITNVELDALLKVLQATATAPPSGLSDATRLRRPACKYDYPFARHAIRFQRFRRGYRGRY